jgi:hypothetical protein
MSFVGWADYRGTLELTPLFSAWKLEIVMETTDKEVYTHIKGIARYSSTIILGRSKIETYVCLLVVWFAVKPGMDIAKAPFGRFHWSFGADQRSTPTTCRVEVPEDLGEFDIVLHALR